MAELWLADVFVGPGCAGNRAAVLLLDDAWPAEQMQYVATQLGQPATTFVRRITGDGAYDLRWFSPAAEIGLCGHGALAAGHVLQSLSNVGDVGLRASDGRRLALRQSGGSGGLEIALPLIAGQPCDAGEWVEILTAQPARMLWNVAGYAAAIFDHAQAVRDFAPNLAALTRRGHIQLSVSAPGDVAGVGVGQIVSRVFSGGREDAATGSAHALIAPYWCNRLGLDRLTAHQLSPNGGVLQCCVEGDQVWVGGECRIVSGPEAYRCG